MINIEVDAETVNNMLEKAINSRVDEVVKRKYFLTYSELAEYLNISRPIIEERLIKNGLKYYRVRTKYLFKRDEMDEFLDDVTSNMTQKNNDLKFFKRICKTEE